MVFVETFFYYSVKQNISKSCFITYKNKQTKKSSIAMVIWMKTFISSIQTQTFVQFIKFSNIQNSISVLKTLQLLGRCQWTETLTASVSFHSAVNRCLHCKWHYSELKVIHAWSNVLPLVLSRWSTLCVPGLTVKHQVQEFKGVPNTNGTSEIL